MSYNAVLFDMDGVVINSESLHVAAFKAVLKKHGYFLTDAQYKKYFAGKTDEEGFRQYFVSEDKVEDIRALMTEKSQLFLRVSGDDIPPYPGVVELIETLASRDVKIALVTGSSRIETEVMLLAINVRRYFSYVVTADDITMSKPDPEGYLKAAALIGVSPDDCVVIEDSPSGIKAANAAHMKCVAVTNTHSDQELQGANLVVGRLTLEQIDTV